MSISVKNKFAGLLRGLLGRGGKPVSTARVSAPATRPAAVPPTLSPALASSTAPAPAAQPASPPPKANEIAVPLAPVVAGLPMELRAKIMSVPPPGMAINVNVETITSQLAFGAVKITFGELRRLAPGIFQNSAGEHDNKLVALPLNEILPRLNPALLSRQTRQKVEVADDIAGPFGGRGHGITFTAQPVKPPTAPVPPAQKIPSAPASPFTPPPRMVTPAAPTPPPTAPSSITPAAPPLGFNRPQPPATNGHSSNGVNGTNGNGHGFKTNGNGNGHVTPPVPPTQTFSSITPINPAPAPVSNAAPIPMPIPAPTVPRPEPAAPAIVAAIWDLAENWPDELKDEISKSALANESVPLSAALVEAGLKRGRVTLTWKQVRTLAKPSSPPSPNDQLELDLPLKVVAPLFFAAQKKVAAAKKKVVVSEEIPNLFFGFPTATEPARSPDKKPNDSNFYVWGENGEVPQAEEKLYAPPPVPKTDFSNRHASPKQVVERAMALPGVAGVVVTLPDGLRVASEVPAELNADTLAAFIPQLFERMNQSAKELRMGALNNISFTVGNVPWRIYRVNAVYVAAFGRAGEALPGAQLVALAGELDRKKQQ